MDRWTTILITGNLGEFPPVVESLVWLSRSVQMILVTKTQRTVPANLRDIFHCRSRDVPVSRSRLAARPSPRDSFLGSTPATLPSVQHQRVKPAAPGYASLRLLTQNITEKSLRLQKQAASRSRILVSLKEGDVLV